MIYHPKAGRKNFVFELELLQDASQTLEQLKKIVFINKFEFVLYLFIMLHTKAVVNKND